MPPARALVADAVRPYEHGFRANLHIVDDKSFDGADPATLSAMALAARHPVLFVADAITLGNPERPVLCVSVKGEGTFRIVPSELWGVENNLSLANMDFEEFAAAVDADGVFRGF